MRNLVAALFRLEGSRGPDDIRRVLRALLEWLRAPQQDSLRRAFTIWLTRVLLPSRIPGVKLQEINELAEVDSMLAERVKEWTERWKQEGLEEGISQGLAAERALLLRQARKRFGDACAETLAPLLETIDDQDRLAEIGEWIVICDSAERLIDNVERQ